MAQNALKILRDPDTYQRLGQAARRTAVERFHPSLIVPQYLAAYRRLAEQ